ncbi:hypothetical protein ABIB75_007369 [Bradyrhizobium sp. GM2.2]
MQGQQSVSAAAVTYEVEALGPRAPQSPSLPQEQAVYDTGIDQTKIDIGTHER